jgi:hypothetical protein
VRISDSFRGAAEGGGEPESTSISTSAMIDDFDVSQTIVYKGKRGDCDGYDVETELDY